MRAGRSAIVWGIAPRAALMIRWRCPDRLTAPCGRFLSAKRLAATGQERRTAGSGHILSAIGSACHFLSK
jgi:hypothetical protein